MSEKLKKRVIGAVVLVAIGILLPVIFVNLFYNDKSDTQTQEFELSNNGEITKLDSKDSQQGKNDTRKVKDQKDDSFEMANNDTQDRSASPEQSPLQQDREAQKQSKEHKPKAFEEPKGGSNNEPNFKPQDKPNEQSHQPDNKPEKTVEKSSLEPEKKQPAKSRRKPQQASLDSLKSKAASGDWIIQIASFQHRQYAVDLAKELGENYSAFYTPVEINGDTWYRVRVGPLSDEAEAKNTAAELHATGYDSAVVRKVH